MKIIVGGWGGGSGQYKFLNDTYQDGAPGMLLVSLGAGEAPATAVATAAAAAAAAAASGHSTTTFEAEASLLGGGRAAGGTCRLNVTSGKCCPGGSFTSVAHVTNTTVCCGLCERHSGCSSFTLNKDEATCYLKSEANTSRSGNCDCGHTGPLPPPGPPNPEPGPGPSPPSHNTSKILLFDVEADAAERFEMSAGHAETVAKLHAMVLEHQRTGVPQATGNASCGRAAPSQDNSTAGNGRLYWGPWC